MLMPRLVLPLSQQTIGDVNDDSADISLRAHNPVSNSLIVLEMLPPLTPLEQMVRELSNMHLYIVAIVITTMRCYIRSLP